MSGIIGKKLGMTSVFGVDGKYIPCTVILAGPCTVTQIRTKETDGYEAVQLAFDEKREKVSLKSEIGHFKKANTTPKRKVVEFREFTELPVLGSEIKVELFDLYTNDHCRALRLKLGRHPFRQVNAPQRVGMHYRLR